MTAIVRSHSRMAAPRTLLIPDIHQDGAFLARILVREPITEFERVILLGDYFDARDPSCRGPGPARRTAQLIRQLESVLGDRLVLLLGNHDLPYFVHKIASRRGASVISDPRGWESILGIAPESQSTARAVCDEWDLAFWRRLRPFAFVQGVLVSHAGLHRRFWPRRVRSVDRALEKLGEQWDQALDALAGGGPAHPILSAGQARGGAVDSVGGLTWLDWDDEFVDDLPVGQIVGHTSTTSRRQHGRSHCIDYGQCAYGVLEGGELSMRPI